MAFVAALVVTARFVDASEECHGPNVVLLMTDDLGYGDLGFRGSQQIPTPHLDALAAEGVECTAGYVSAPVCNPSRAGLMTGRYQQRFGFVLGAGLNFRPLPRDERVLVQRLRSAGYTTGMVGKWHLGKGDGRHPLDRGFDFFFGLLGGGHMYAPKDELPVASIMPFPIPDDAIKRNRRSVDEPAYLTDAFGREAARFIERHHDRPFFLNVQFNAPHVPLQAPERYLDRFPESMRKPRRTYAAMVSAVDDAVGRIMKKLREHGLVRRTLIIFSNDNGGHPKANAASNEPLRGSKGTLYEGGIRVPFVLRWTGNLPAGERYHRPVSTLDIMPTALAAAGLELPEQIDGVNLLPHLRGERRAAPHNALYWRSGRHNAVRQGRWKLLIEPGESPALYDLSCDIAESDDVSDERPAVADRLLERLNAWRRRTAQDPLPGR